MFGPDVFVLLLVLAAWFVVPIWAIVDALFRPALSFYVAGWNKTAWVIVLLVATTLGVGLLLGGFYLLSVRRKVRQVRLQTLPV